MYLINKIEHIDNKENRKDIYGMFLIHQEKCEIHEIFDQNIEIDYVCPCSEITNYLKLLNFHLNHNKHSIESHEENKDEKSNLIVGNQELKRSTTKEKSKFAIEVKKYSSKDVKSSTEDNKSSRIKKENEKKKEELKEEKKDEESMPENSENKAMMVIIN